MKSIKTIAGDLLLFFYARQRKTGTIEDIIEFQNDRYKEQFVGDPSELKGQELKANSQLSKGILEISEDSNNAYNALRYLKEKGFISWKKDRISGVSEVFLNLRVSASGIDIIEGIERGENEKAQFNFFFNIKLADNIKVDSLIKLQLDSLIKASLL